MNTFVDELRGGVLANCSESDLSRIAGANRNGRVFSSIILLKDAPGSQQVACGRDTPGLVENADTNAVSVVLDCRNSRSFMRFWMWRRLLGRAATSTHDSSTNNFEIIRSGQCGVK